MGRPPATVHRWLSGARGISSAVAVELEDATGIKAEAWIFPKRFKNPYFELKKKAS